MRFFEQVAQETVQLVPSSAPCCVARSEALGKVLQLLKQHSHSGVLVCDNGVLAGIFTERDALQVMTRKADLRDSVERHMTARPSTLAPTSTIGEAMGKMSRGGFRRLPVVDDRHRPLAVIDMAALVHYVDGYFPGAVYNLPPKAMLCTPERAGA